MWLIFSKVSICLPPYKVIIHQLLFISSFFKYTFTCVCTPNALLCILRFHSFNSRIPLLNAWTHIYKPLDCENSHYFNAYLMWRHVWVLIVRPTDKEMTSIEKRVYYTQKSPPEGQMGVTRLRWRGRGDEGKMWTRTFIVVSVGGNRRGRIGRLRIG